MNRIELHRSRCKLSIFKTIEHANKVVWKRKREFSGWSEVGKTHGFVALQEAGIDEVGVGAVVEVELEILRQVGPPGFFPHGVEGAGVFEARLPRGSDWAKPLDFCCLVHFGQGHLRSQESWCWDCLGVAERVAVHETGTDRVGIEDLRPFAILPTSAIRALVADGNLGNG